MSAARAHRLAFSYGTERHRALDGVSVDVRPGEVLVLEGPSGGGKSTLLRALGGLVPHFHGGRMSGSVEVGGLDTRTATPAAIARHAGILFQDPEAQAVLGGVARDVAFGLENAGADPAGIPAAVDAALETAGALHLRDRRVDTLSGGERQRVALAGVLARRPRLLLLDEPTSQLDDAAADDLMGVLRRLADEGVGIVMSEHRADRAAPVADRVVAVREGRLGEPTVRAVAEAERASSAPGAVVVRGDGLHVALDGVEVLRGVDVALRAGTVTALLGPNGSGKSTLLRTLAGLECPERGRVLLGGEDVSAVPAARRFPRLALVVQDPGRHLLCERVDLEARYALDRLGVGGREAAARVDAVLGELGVAGLAARHPLDLSVGERERVAVAAALVADPGAILLDEPTRGMDPARRADLASVLRRRAAGGAAVLVATHDPAFAAAVADVVLRISGGVVAEVPLAAAVAA